MSDKFPEGFYQHSIHCARRRHFYLKIAKETERFIKPYELTMN